MQSRHHGCLPSPFHSSVFLFFCPFFCLLFTRPGNSVDHRVSSHWSDYLWIIMLLVVLIMFSTSVTCFFLGCPADEISSIYSWRKGMYWRGEFFVLSSCYAITFLEQMWNRTEWKTLTNVYRSQMDQKSTGVDMDVVKRLKTKVYLNKDNS